MVFPRRLKSANLSRHFRLNPSSPTARTSSIRRTSGSTWTATANPNRMYMPDEYVLTGESMKSSISANSTISSNRSAISRFVSPSITPFMKMFSRPEISGWNPAPSSIRAEIRPRTCSVPVVGLVIPATSFSSVLLPEPFLPMRPIVLPGATSNDTPSTARSTSRGSSSLARLPLSSALLSVENCRRYAYRRYSFVTSRSAIAGSVTLPPRTSHAADRRERSRPGTVPRRPRPAQATTSSVRKARRRTGSPGTRWRCARTG